MLSCELDRGLRWGGRPITAWSCYTKQILAVHDSTQSGHSWERIRTILYPARRFFFLPSRSILWLNCNLQRDPTRPPLMPRPTWACEVCPVRAGGRRRPRLAAGHPEAADLRAALSPGVGAEAMRQRARRAVRSPRRASRAAESAESAPLAGCHTSHGWGGSAGSGGRVGASLWQARYVTHTLFGRCHALLAVRLPVVHVLLLLLHIHLALRRQLTSIDLLESHQPLPPRCQNNPQPQHVRTSEPTVSKKKKEQKRRGLSAELATP